MSEQTWRIYHRLSGIGSHGDEVSIGWLSDDLSIAEGSIRRALQELRKMGHHVTLERGSIQLWT